MFVKQNFNISRKLLTFLRFRSLLNSYSFLFFFKKYSDLNALYNKIDSNNFKVFFLSSFSFFGNASFIVVFNDVNLAKSFWNLISSDIIKPIYSIYNKSLIFKQKKLLSIFKKLNFNSFQGLILIFQSLFRSFFRVVKVILFFYHKLSYLFNKLKNYGY